MYICISYNIYIYIYIYIIKENRLTLKKQEADNILQNITDADYANDLVLLTYTPVQSKFQLKKQR